ncbi:MAG: NUDIX hydrolase [Planctomycetes bacterium]|nr:NUDIX hydrolase [Planctomycetota bacterium]
MGFTVRRAREIYRGRVFRLTEQDVVLPNGRETTFSIVEHPGAVAVVPLFENGDVLLVRQFRLATKGYLYEIPAGTLEPGEAPAATARRELIEETGYRCRSLKKFAEFYAAPGFCTELMRLFVARGLTRTRAEPEADEVIKPLRVSYRKALDMVRRGRIRDAKSMIGLLMTHGRG